jgi:hypothetical protein
MTAVGWVLLAVLAAVVVWLVLAMIGLVREVAALRAELRGLTERPIELGGGLPIGSVEPAWTIETGAGAIASSAYAGRRHVLMFADADCRACDDLVPEVARATAGRALPPVVVVGPDGTDLPSSWTGPGMAAGREHARDVSDAFRVDVSPHVFVLDEGGAVVAQGGAMTLADVEALVHDGQATRIVPGASLG